MTGMVTLHALRLWDSNVNLTVAVNLRECPEMRQRPLRGMFTAPL